MWDVNWILNWVDWSMINMRKNDTRVRRSMWDIAFVDCVDWDVWKSQTYFVRGKRTEAWFWHVAWSEKKSKRYYFFRLWIFMISKLSLNIKPPRLWPGLKWLFMPGSISFPLSTRNCFGICHIIALGHNASLFAYWSCGKNNLRRECWLHISPSYNYFPHGPSSTLNRIYWYIF